MSQPSIYAPRSTMTNNVTLAVLVILVVLLLFRVVQRNVLKDALTKETMCNRYCVPYATNRVVHNVVARSDHTGPAPGLSMREMNGGKRRRSQKGLLGDDLTGATPY